VSVAIYRPLDLIGFSFIVLLFYLLAAGNAGVKDPKITLSTILGSIGMQVFIVGIVVMMISRRADLVDWLGLKWVKWPQVFWIAPATVVSMWIVFSLLFSLGYMDLMERLGVEKVQDAVAMFQNEKDPMLLGLMAFAAVIVAPICEEAVFRGYLYPVAKRFAGPWISALCTALIFSATHGSMSALLPLFLFGLILAAIYEATGSLWAPISIHCLFNGATVLIQLLLRYFEIPEDFGS
jgi:membrane protease YdiL (CAAX protease family)